MSSRNLLKHFKSCFFICFLCLSCVKQEKQIVIKVGERVWTFKEVQDYFHIRLQSYSVEEKLPENLKKELLNELFLRSFVENWAKKEKKRIQNNKISSEERQLFLKDKGRLRALKDHKSYLSLYNLLLKDLSKQTEKVSLPKQKDFYKKNKKFFSQPAGCHLKQIVVEKENLAKSLQKKLKEGSDFDKLSKIYSLNKHPGWIEKGDLKVFDQACFSYEEGLSPVLKSPYGYHIFLVGKKKASQQKPFSAVQKQIIQILTKKKQGEQFQIWLKKEFSKTPVWTNRKLLDKIHIQYKNNST